MTAYVTMDSMTKRFALITWQKFAGCRRCAAGSTQATARMGARARACDAHGHAGSRGERTKVRDGEVERW